MTKTKATPSISAASVIPLPSCLWTTRTPIGPATERVRLTSAGSILVDAWGPGAEWLLQRAGGRAIAPAAAIEQKCMVPQVIVVVSDQNIKCHSTEELSQIGKRIRTKPAYGLGKIAV